MPRRLAAIVLVLGLTAACSGDAPTAARGPEPSGSGTEAAPRSGAAGPTPTGSARAPASPAPSTTASPATAADDESATRPPAPGTYRYRQSGNGVLGDFPDHGTLEVGAVRTAGGVFRQRAVRTYSDRESSRQVFEFRPSGVWLVEVTQSFGTGSVERTYTCHFDDPLQVTRSPARIDSEWTGSSSCDGVTVSFTGRYLREETRTVDGTAVRTVVLRTTIDAQGDDVRQKTTATLWLSPEHRLVVRSVQESTGRQGAITYSTSLTEDLLDLRPR